LGVKSFMDAKNSLGRYRIIKELFDGDIQSAYVCADTDDNSSEGYIINVYKNREIIDIVLQHLFILEDNNFGDYLHHFVYGKYVCAVFKQRHGIPLNEYIKTHSLSQIEALELAKSVLKKVISLQRTPVALLTKLLTYQNIIVLGDGIEFCYVLDCRDMAFSTEEQDLIIGIGAVFRYIFNSVENPPAKLKRVIDKCLHGKYNSLLEICPELEDIIKRYGINNEISKSLQKDEIERDSLSETQRMDISELLSKYSDIIGADVNNERANVNQNKKSNKTSKENSYKQDKKNVKNDAILFVKVLLIFLLFAILLFGLYIILFPESYFFGMRNSFIRDSIAQLFGG